MRVAVIYRPRSAPPVEQLPMLVAGLAQWVEQHAAKFSTLEFFVAGGGFGVIDVDDAADLNRLTAENPFTPYSEVEIRPVLDPRAGLATLAELASAHEQAAG